MKQLLTNKENYPEKEIFFKNNIGTIYDSSIHIKGHEFIITEIAFICQKKITNYNYNLFFFILSMISFFLKFLFLHNLNVLFVFMGLFFIGLSLFYKKWNFYIQIIFSKPNQKMIPISRNELHDVKVLLKAINKHRISHISFINTSD